ncbi:MAG: GGDEF domain-containing protein [Spirochaetales bacterium]|nr:GGDEF domain-containing protein [Spirochaetales bacterium]
MDKKKYIEKRSFMVAVTFLFLIVMFFLYINISNFVFHKAGAELAMKTGGSMKNILEYSQKDEQIDLQLLKTLIKNNDFYLPMLNLTVYDSDKNILMKEGKSLSLKKTVLDDNFCDDLIHSNISITDGNKKIRVYEVYFSIFGENPGTPIANIVISFNLDQFSDLFSGKQFLMLSIFLLTLLILIFLVMIILGLQQQLFQSEEKITQLNTRDDITGLLTREAFMEKFRNEIVRISQTGGQLSVITADLDNFMSVCDKAGHDFGNHILKTVAKIFQTNLRVFDIIGRFGSDEIIAVMIGTTAQECLEIAEKCRIAIKETEFYFNDKKIPVSMSFGISSTSNLEQKTTEQIKHDLLFDSLGALAQSKQEGKNCCILK